MERDRYKTRLRYMYRIHQMVSRIFCILTTNFHETEFDYLFLYTEMPTFIFVEKDRRFVVREFVKLSDEFDIIQNSLFPVGMRDGKGAQTWIGMIPF